MGFLAVGASLFSSNIGSEHFIGLSGSGASEGIAIGWYEWSAVFILAVLAYVFVPIYMRAKIFTTPEFIEKRFNRYIRSYLAILSLLFYIFTKISATIFAVAVLLDTVLGWNIYISSACILISTGIYTIAGGLSAVIYTEVLQTIVLIGGAVILTILGFIRAGGLGNLMQHEPNMFHLFKPINDSQLPWLGIVLGIWIPGLQYWCGDQVIVQRVLSAKSKVVAQSGCMLASLLKILPVFILVMPGIISRYLYPNEIAHDSNRAFPLLVMNIMPPFTKGLLISSMLAAAMSSLASVFNSASTIFVMDVYKLIRKQGNGWEYVFVGRLSIAVLIVLSLLWIPIITKFSDQLFVYVQSMQSYMMPPWTALFFCGVLSTRVTSFGSMLSLLIGLIIGIARFICEIVFKTTGSKWSNSTKSNVFIYFFSELNYLYFGAVLFAICIFVTVIFSLLTPKKWTPDIEQIRPYTIDWNEVLYKFTLKRAPTRSIENQTEGISELRELEEIESSDVEGHAKNTNQAVAIETETQPVEQKTTDLPEPNKSDRWLKYNWLVFVFIILPLMIFLIVYFR
jgi:SSS family solute:Na+ symporter